MACDQENSVGDELEALRIVLRRLGFELNDEELKKLAPQASAILHDGFSIADIDLSGIEPVTAFDARWIH
jgi:hypothetical protein